MLRILILAVAFSLSGAVLAESQPVDQPVPPISAETKNSDKPENGRESNQAIDSKPATMVKSLGDGDSQKNAPNNEDNGNTEPFEWLNSIFNLLLVTITGGLVFVAWQQHHTTRAIERAYVKLSYTQPGVAWERGKDNFFYIRIEAKNFGHTPAHISDVNIEAKILENDEMLPLPLPFSIDKRRIIPGAFLVSGESFTHERPFPAHEREFHPVKMGEKRLWIFGYVDYIDVFKRRHRGTFARTYSAITDDGNRNNLFYPSGRKYDSDYERKPGEGNDWGEE